jgi:hypothetical protein
MAEVKTVKVTIERTVTTTVDWEIDMYEFEQWSSVPAYDINDPQCVKEFIMSSVFYNDALRDKILDTPPHAWRDAYSFPEAEITKVVIL